MKESSFACPEAKSKSWNLPPSNKQEFLAVKQGPHGSRGGGESDGQGDSLHYVFHASPLSL